MTTVIGVIALGFVVWAIVAGLLSVRYCQRHGVVITPVLLGIEMIRCLGKYRTLTREQTGHVGPLFYHYVIPINLALVLAVILLLATGSVF